MDTDTIVGTAGHIDHGKTALVKALTGVDADRLPEEKRRGITVDIGFAEMSVGGAHFGFVDVPGHERFVKNMLAGASGIDIVMLVVAADEGVMPQTREHFDICRLLGIRKGIVVLSRIDLVDAETLEFAKMDVAELVAQSFLEDTPVVCVSSKTGEGIDSLKSILVRQGSELPARENQMITRLPIDRSFSMKGFGAIVTGTLASGDIIEGAEMQLLPTGQKVRIRGLQTHGRPVKSASAGRRVAVNLGGIDHSRVSRGMVLSEPNILRPTQIIDAEVEVLADAAKPIRSRQRVRVHVGTAEVLARIQVLNAAGEIAAGSKDFLQIRLETPIVTVPGERFILRRYSPQVTIAGGEMIDTFAGKHRRKELANVRNYLRSLSVAANDLPARIELLLNAAGPSGLDLQSLQSRMALLADTLRTAVNACIADHKIVAAEGYFVASNVFVELSGSAIDAIGKFHKSEPLARGMSRETLRETVFEFLPPEIFQSVLASLEKDAKVVLDKETIRLAGHKAELSPAELELTGNLLLIYRSAGLEVPKLDDALRAAITNTKFTPQDGRKCFQLFLDSGKIVKVTDEFYFAKEVLDSLTERLRKFADKTQGRLIDVAKFKELSGVSRKYAIPLLEYYDREKVTRRAGDQRLVQ